MSQVPQQEPALQETGNCEVISNYPLFNALFLLQMPLSNVSPRLYFWGVVKVLRATLYVKGVRTKFVKDLSYQGYVVQNMGAVGTYAPPPRIWPDYKVIKKTTHKSVLPEDQKALIETVKAAAVKYSFELKVIDVTVSSLHRLRARLRGISTFPARATDRGLKIEGDITEERIKALLAK